MTKYIRKGSNIIIDPTMVVVFVYQIEVNAEPPQWWIVPLTESKIKQGLQ
jgi:hypothetical protein